MMERDEEGFITMSQISQASSKRFCGPSLLLQIENITWLSHEKIEALKQLTLTLLCSICGDLYEDPCAIDCSHTFCRDCLESRLEKRAECPNTGCRIPAYRCDIRTQRDIAQSMAHFRILILHIGSVRSANRLASLGGAAVREDAREGGGGEDDAIDHGDGDGDCGGPGSRSSSQYLDEDAWLNTGEGRLSHSSCGVTSPVVNSPSSSGEHGVELGAASSAHPPPAPSQPLPPLPAETAANLPVGGIEVTEASHTAAAAASAASDSHGLGSSWAETGSLDCGSTLVEDLGSKEEEAEVEASSVLDHARDQKENREEAAGSGAVCGAVGSQESSRGAGSTELVSLSKDISSASGNEDDASGSGGSSGGEVGRVCGQEESDSGGDTDLAPDVDEDVDEDDEEDDEAGEGAGEEEVPGMGGDSEVKEADGREERDVERGETFGDVSSATFIATAQSLCPALPPVCSGGGEEGRGESGGAEELGKCGHERIETTADRDEEESVCGDGEKRGGGGDDHEHSIGDNHDGGCDDEACNDEVLCEETQFNEELFPNRKQPLLAAARSPALAGSGGTDPQAGDSQRRSSLVGVAGGSGGSAGGGFGSGGRSRRQRASLTLSFAPTVDTFDLEPSFVEDSLAISLAASPELAVAAAAAGAAETPTRDTAVPPFLSSTFTSELLDTQDKASMVPETQQYFDDDGDDFDGDVIEAALPTSSSSPPSSSSSPPQPLHSGNTLPLSPPQAPSPLAAGEEKDASKQAHDDPVMNAAFAQFFATTDGGTYDTQQQQSVPVLEESDGDENEAPCGEHPNLEVLSREQITNAAAAAAAAAEEEGEGEEEEEEGGMLGNGFNEGGTCKERRKEDANDNHDDDDDDELSEEGGEKESCSVYPVGMGLSESATPNTQQCLHVAAQVKKKRQLEVTSLGKAESDATAAGQTRFEEGGGVDEKERGWHHRDISNGNNDDKRSRGENSSGVNSNIKKEEEEEGEEEEGDGGGDADDADGDGGQDLALGERVESREKTERGRSLTRGKSRGQNSRERRRGLWSDDSGDEVDSADDAAQPLVLGTFSSNQPASRRSGAKNASGEDGACSGDDVDDIDDREKGSSQNNAREGDDWIPHLKQGGGGDKGGEEQEEEGDTRRGRDEGCADEAGASRADSRADSRAGVKRRESFDPSGYRSRASSSSSSSNRHRRQPSSSSLSSLSPSIAGGVRERNSDEYPSSQRGGRGGGGSTSSGRRSQLPLEHSNPNRSSSSGFSRGRGTGGSSSKQSSNHSGSRSSGDGRRSANKRSSSSSGGAGSHGEALRTPQQKQRKTLGSSSSASTAALSTSRSCASTAKYSSSSSAPSSRSPRRSLSPSPLRQPFRFERRGGSYQGVSSSPPLASSLAPEPGATTTTNRALLGRLSESSCNDSNRDRERERRSSKPCSRPSPQSRRSGNGRDTRDSSGSFNNRSGNKGDKRRSALDRVQLSGDQHGLSAQLPGAATSSLGIEGPGDGWVDRASKATDRMKVAFPGHKNRLPGKQTAVTAFFSSTAAIHDDGF